MKQVYTSMQPLDGPRLKVRRAKAKAEALFGAQETFWEQSNYEVVRAEFDPDWGQDAHRVLIDVLPPLDWGLCIGEIAHDLRSALDNLVYQLGKANGASEEALTRALTQFPIFLDGRPRKCQRSQWKRGRWNRKCRANGSHFNCRGREMIDPLRSGHKAMIESLQPYKCGNGGVRNLLYFLQEINNADKHRLIQVAGAKRGITVMSYWGEGIEPTDSGKVISFRHLLEDGAIVAYTASDVNMYPKLAPLVAFGDGCRAVEGLTVTHTLRQIAEHVSEIVESFRFELE